MTDDSEPSAAFEPPSGGAGPSLPPENPPSNEDATPTVQMPVVPAAPAGGSVAPSGSSASAASVAGISSAVADNQNEFIKGESEPWYKNPAIAIGIVVGLITAGLIAWFVLGGEDSDDASSVNTLTITRRDVAGNALVRSITATVAGPSNSRGEFLWLEPPNALAPSPAAGVTSGADGAVTFRWAPTAEVADPTRWLSIVVLSEELPSGFDVSAPEFGCSLTRRKQRDSTVLLATEVGVDPVSDVATVTYVFPGFQFQPGDTVRCDVTDAVIPTTSTTTTTIPETTTTVPSTSTTTTLPASTTTALTTTTTAPATTTPVVTTVPVTTAAPTTTTPPESAIEIIDRRSDLSELRALVDLAGLRNDLTNPSQPLTVFAPNNAAIAAAMAAPGAPDFTDPAVVRDILNVHLSLGVALTEADLLAATDVAVANGGAQPLDAAATPPTIGGAGLVEIGVGQATSALHIVDAVLTAV